MKSGANSHQDSSMLLVLTAVGAIWLRSSLGKIMSGDFVQTLGQTLTRFSQKNPYPWFKDFLENTVIPNSEFYGMVVMGGELLTACLIILGGIYLLFMKKQKGTMSLLLACGLLIGVFLNGLFWLAAGYTSPSTDSLNLLMVVVQLSGLLYLSKAQIG